jgi:hypothetical protein
MQTRFALNKNQCTYNIVTGRRDDGFYTRTRLHANVWPGISVSVVAQPQPIIVYSCHLSIEVHHKGKVQFVGDKVRGGPCSDI